jgi:hypothetical protein
VASAYGQIYNDAGGGQGGLKAVDEEFKRLANAAMSQDDVMRAFGAQMNTTKSKVQVFNNEMQQIAEKIAGDVLPAFEALAPLVVGAAGRFAEFINEGNVKPSQDRAFGAQVGGTNFLSKLHAFENTNLDQKNNKYGLGVANQSADINADISMDRAAPVFAEGEKKQAAIAKEIAEVEGRLAKEGGGSTNTWGSKVKDLSDPELHKLADNGSKDAQKYIADKAALERLQQTNSDISSSMDALRTAILSGQVTVKLAPGSGSPPATTPGGSAPSNTPEPE